MFIFNIYVNSTLDKTLFDSDGCVINNLIAINKSSFSCYNGEFCY